MRWKIHRHARRSDGSKTCATWKRRYPLITDDYREASDFVNSYLFIDALSDAMGEGETLVPRDRHGHREHLSGLSTQKGPARAHQRVGLMGWDLPLSIGASWGAGKSRVVTVTGDGSIQWNIQKSRNSSLQTPNQNFHLQQCGLFEHPRDANSFFEGRSYTSHPVRSIDNPDYSKLAEAYDFGYAQIRNNGEIVAGIAAFLCER